MDYLTNYYKNLCEQLQEKLNILEAQINEGRYNPETGKVERFRDDMRQTTDKLERKAPSRGSFKVDSYSSTEPLNPATIIPRKPATKDQPIVPERKPDYKTDDRFPLRRGVGDIGPGANLNITNIAQQSQNTPLEKDTIKNFIQSIRAGAKPGEKIKKTQSKILYGDEETPYIQ